MVKISFEQKPGRKTVINMFGGDVHPSPSSLTEYGRSVLKNNPNTPGSLGMAITEAIELALKGEKTKYALGSVLNHVLMHQTIIGQEVQKQLELVDAGEPDIMIGCIGGGSNFGGFTFPFVGEKLRGKRYENTEFIGVEPKVCPTVTKGEYRYDFADTGKMTPMLKMYTLGYNFVPPPIHAGGLRYHGMAPTISLLMKHKLMKSESYPTEETFRAAKTFAMTEGIVVAPETSHAIASTIYHALEAKKNGEKKTIVFNLSGHGLLDLRAYENK